MNKLLVCLIFFLSTFLPCTVTADEHPAQALVVEYVNELLEFVREDSAAIEKNRTLLTEKLNELIAPVLDDEWIARKVTGKHWKKATPEQKVEFTSEFKQFLLTTYGVTIFEYREGSIEFSPYKPGKKDNVAKVSATIKLPGGDKVPFKTRLGNRDGWKIQNIEVADFNMVINYRSYFGDKILNDGFEGAINELKKKNKK